MTLVVAAMAVSANAQLYVGGGVGLTSSKWDTDGAENVTSYKFIPEIGYNFTDDMAVGIAFGWLGSNKGGAKAFSMNPYLRYTFLKQGMVSVFADATVGYAHAYSDPIYEDKRFKSVDGIEAGIKPGVAFNVTDKFSVVAHVGFLGWEQVKLENYTGGTAKRNNYGLDLDGNNLSLSLYYKF